jgi:formylglycine-generating enzyme required for sulfatase activity
MLFFFVYRRLRPFFCLSIFLLASCAQTAGEAPRAQTPNFDMVTIPGGTFVMGDLMGDANERPEQVSVAPFQLMRLEVTLAGSK